jgi:chromosome segregation ATPase
MNDISKLEERVQEALSVIDSMVDGFDAFVGGGKSSSDDLSVDVAERDARIAEMAKELEELRARLSEGEDRLQQAERRRRADMAELDEIIEQLEPLIQGRT